MRFILNKMPKLLLFMFVFVALTSCGPVEYMGQVGVKAAKSHAALKQAHGEKYSPYEYWSSKYYLERARYKAGYGDYQDSVRYGKKAEKNSTYGRKRAILEKKREVEIGQAEAEAAEVSKKDESPKPVKLKLEIKKKGDSQ